MVKQAHFEISGFKIAPMESGHFTGFSGIGRIGNPGIIRSFLD
jgi:hypothetical protein